MAFCNQCGASVPDGTRYCPSCGTEQSAQAAAQPQQTSYTQPQQPSYTQPQQSAYTQPQQPAYTQPGYNQQYPQQSGEYAPVVTTKQFLGMFLLMLIPIANIILPFVWAFGEGNPNRKNLWRAALIMALIGIALSILISVLVGASLFSIFSSIKDYGY